MTVVRASRPIIGRSPKSTHNIMTRTAARTRSIIIFDAYAGARACVYACLCAVRTRPCACALTSHYKFMLRLRGVWLRLRKSSSRSSRSILVCAFLFCVNSAPQTIQSASVVGETNRVLHNSVRAIIRNSQGGNRHGRVVSFNLRVAYDENRRPPGRWSVTWHGYKASSRLGRELLRDTVFYFKRYNFINIQPCLELLSVPMYRNCHRYWAVCPDVPTKG